MLSRREIAKDLLQQSTEATLSTTGHLAIIVVEAARKVTNELGALGTELFEIGEAARRAGDDDAG